MDYPLVQQGIRIEGSEFPCLKIYRLVIISEKNAIMNLVIGRTKKQMTNTMLPITN